MTDTCEKTVKIRGPFWAADAVIVTLNNPKWHHTLRTLFTDINPRAESFGQLNMPGTLLMLVFVRKVVVLLNSHYTASFTFSRPSGDATPGGALTPAAIRDFLQKGRLSLLLCSTDPSKWGGDFGPDDVPEATCELGEVALDGLTPEHNARTRLYDALALTEVPLAQRPATGAARLTSGLAVHGSGLTALGKLTPAWEAATASVTAPFQLAREIPDPANGPRYRITVEDQRLTSGERAAWIASWERFARLFDPGNPAFMVPGADRVVPRWGTLGVVDPRRVPHLYWELPTAPLAIKPGTLGIKIDPGEIDVILADQDPREPSLPPTAIARISPTSVSLTVATNKDLQLAVNAGTAPTIPAKVKYTATRAANVWTEGLTLTGLTMAFDPIEAARRAREAMGSEAPVWDRATPVEPPVTFAALKLEDGWAQLPVPNLTEQMYLDAELANAPSTVTPNLEGAVSFGNDKSGVVVPGPREQPWSVTVLDARAVTGTWTTTGITELTKAEINLLGPEVVIDGLFWFGSARPTVEDALPSLDDWLGGLRSLPVATMDATDVFPAPVQLTFEDVSLSLQAGAKGSFPAAVLSGWRATYDANAATLKQMVDRHLLPVDLFARALPLVWRRHPTLPMVQALPLTQNQVPPNAPSASRQLVPFELPVVASAAAGGLLLPSGWKLGADKRAAETWPVVMATLAPAREWLLVDSSSGQEVRRGIDLPLVALSLPGLQLAPAVELSGLDGALGLSTQYRLDLPYVDQLHALAQLPRLPKPASAMTPPPAADEAQREKPLPLGRADFAGHFGRLAEKAALAAADLVSAVAVGVGGKPEVRGLVEPAVWPVKATLDTAIYPGKLTLDNQTGSSAPLSLTGDQALRGIDGIFVDEAENTLRRATAGSDGFEITAGSMADRRTAAAELRDQRGLLRVPVAVGAKLTRTRLKLVDAADAFTLTSALQGFDLALGPEGLPGTQKWRFWFRDLPCKSTGFDRAATLSSSAEDINDPEGRTRRFEYLGGYEWRIADTTNREVRRKLFGIDFFPLTLDSVVFDGEDVTSVKIVGRLQLPLGTAPFENESLTNAVRLTFTRPAGASLPALSEIAQVSPEGVWPLAAAAAAGDAPRIVWNAIALGTDKASLSISGATLAFSLFDLDWGIPLAPLSFRLPIVPLHQAHVPTVKPTTEPLAPAQVTLDLNLETGVHAATLELGLQLGTGIKNMPVAPRTTPLVWQLAPATAPAPTPSTVRSAFCARVSFLLTAPQSGAITWLSGALFDDLEVPTSDATASAYVDRSLQFRWSSHVAGTGRPQVLPGMALTPGASSGFAALAFDALPPAKGVKDVPTLPVRSSFVEAFLPCRWGDFLQQEAAAASADNARLYGSSAGDVFFGFTGQSSGTTWTQSLLANGLIEVKNLVSWPFALTFDEASGTLSLPAGRGTPQPVLSHLRHTIRILLDQHVVPMEALVNSVGDPLFRLAAGKSWQFQATVEHQLVEVVPDATGALVLRRDRRFVAAQEVRLLSPVGLKNALNASAGRRLSSPVWKTEPLGESSFGLWAKMFSKALTSGTPSPLDALGDALIMEASAPLLLSQAPLKGLAPTSLQFLPTGTQTASLSSLDDFLPGDPMAPPWALVTLPFLGRLQDTTKDGTAEPGPTNPSPLQVDPVLQIDRSRRKSPAVALAPLLLALANRGDNKNEDFKLSAFDGTLGRQFARLDPISVEESWFRMQAPASEPPLDRLESVLRSLPDSPARMGRPAALARLRDPARAKYPPATAAAAIATDELQEGPVWRPKSLLFWQAIANRGPKDAIYAFHVVGVELAAVGFLTRPPGGAAEIVTHVAVAVLPANPAQSSTPESLALSPFVRLGFLGAPGDARVDPISLLAAELLCLDESRSQIVSAARHLWQALPKASRTKVVEDWARDTQRLLCPGSPFAIVRERLVLRTKDKPATDEAAVVTEIGFRVIALDQTDDVRRRLFRVRSTVKDLRFRDGRFGGPAIPDAIRPFEVAPPLVTGVQPLRLEARPGPAPTPPPPAPPSKTKPRPLWDFGWSGLRMTVEPLVRGVAGSVQESTPVSIWWQGVSSAVQFRSAATKLPTAGFPSGFRARAVEALLPVLPQPPLPADMRDRLGGDKRWQPVLPSRTRFITLGQRPGVLHAYRAALQRQAWPTITSVETSVMVSGGVPLQHRFPRPVALPPTDAEYPELALRPWASAFASTTPALITLAPADEAYFAGAPGGADAARLALRLLTPELGVVSTAWDGQLVFAVTAEGGSPKPSWQVLVRISVDGRAFNFSTKDAIATGTVAFTLDTVAGGDSLVTLRAALAGHVGSPVDIEVRVAREQSLNAYFQVLSFPLRFRPTPVSPSAPLVPVFAHFEDPEYNRRLASSAKQARLDCRLADKKTIESATLSADREQYNSDSIVILRYDGTTAIDALEPMITFARIEASGVVKALAFAREGDVGPDLTKPLPSGSVLTFSLDQLREKVAGVDQVAVLAPGHALQVTLRLKTGDLTTLELPIVDEPQVPVPQAGYALLRRSFDALAVECVRFAWMPPAQRIELINPEDLKLGVVRRRAVFHFLDTARSQGYKDYALQKVTASGSTHECTLLVPIWRYSRKAPQMTPLLPGKPYDHATKARPP